MAMLNTSFTLGLIGELKYEKYGINTTIIEPAYAAKMTNVDTASDPIQLAIETVQARS